MSASNFISLAAEAGQTAAHVLPASKAAEALLVVKTPINAGWKERPSAQS